MNFYETMYIVHPALQSGRLDDIIQLIDNKVEKLKGNKLYLESWGKKKLAYPIEKQKYGTYVLLQFSLQAEMINELKNEFEHNTNILRYLINKIDQDAVMEEKEQPQKENVSETVKEKSEIKENVSETVKEKSEIKDTDDEKEKTTTNKEEETE